MLDRHLESLREKCRNKDMLELLVDDRKPLVLSVTFNSEFTFESRERDDPPELMVARRLLASYFKIDWLIHKYSLLSSSGPGVLIKTLKVIARHHKRTHGLNESTQIAILINVDELNQISKILDIDVDSSSHSLSQQIVREIVNALRGLCMSGIDGPSPVFPLLAGTAYKHFVDSLSGSGIAFMHQSMPILSSDQVLEALRGCGVPEEYLRNRDFLRLLDESGGVPRVIRMILEKLTLEYDPSRIEDGRNNAFQYLKERYFLKEEDIVGLLPSVVLGKACDLSSAIPGSKLIYEDLQRNGVVWMKPFGNMYQATMPLLSLRAFCEKNSDHPDVRRVMELLNLLDNTSWSEFEHLCARFSGYKMSHLALLGYPGVTMRHFYGVDMAPDVAKLVIELSSSKEYEAEVLKAIDKRQSFPMKKETSSPKAKINANASLESLLSGKVIVNLKGAPVDCVMVDPLQSGGMLVRALCISHTTDDLMLNQKKLDQDHTNAMNAVRGSALLSKEKCITVHLSNRKLHKNLLPTKDSIVIGQDNLCAFFGPVLSRGMWSNTHLIRNTEWGISRGETPLE
jgi:hypothetical protein